MDPISLLTGAGIFLLGLGTGAFTSYDGPQPIEKFLATPTLLPRDGG